MPDGIDPGFGYNPGKVSLASTTVQQLTAKVQQLQVAAPAIGRAAQAAGPALTTHQDYAAAGRVIAEQHWTALGGVDLQKARVWRDAVLAQLKAERSFGTPAQLASSGAGSQIVRDASRLYPDAWTAVADAAGALHVRGSSNSRGWAWTVTAQHDGRPVRLKSFGTVQARLGEGYIEVCTGDLGNAVHEYAHRLQATLPSLDALFQQLHRDRTVNDPLESLRALTGLAYHPREHTRKDHYANPYQGREYGQGNALEVMTMAFEYFLTDNDRKLRNLLEDDSDMANLVIGLLRHWKP